MSFLWFQNSIEAEADFTPIGVIPSICEALNKYDFILLFSVVVFRLIISFIFPLEFNC